MRLHPAHHASTSRSGPRSSDNHMLGRHLLGSDIGRDIGRRPPPARQPRRPAPGPTADHAPAPRPPCAYLPIRPQIGRQPHARPTPARQTHRQTHRQPPTARPASQATGAVGPHRRPCACIPPTMRLPPDPAPDRATTTCSADDRVATTCSATWRQPHARRTPGHPDTRTSAAARQPRAGGGGARGGAGRGGSGGSREGRAADGRPAPPLAEPPPADRPPTADPARGPAGPTTHDPRPTTMENGPRDGAQPADHRVGS